jgi:hypothetical protein
MARTIIGMALVATMVIALAPTGSAEETDLTVPCDAFDGKFSIADQAFVGELPAPEGIVVDSATPEQVVFTVAEGIRVAKLCVETSADADLYTADTEFPTTGPKTITLGMASSELFLEAVSFDTGDSNTRVCPDVEPPAIEFGEPSFIDRNRAGGEPVAVVAQDGSINVSAHAGTTHVYKDPMALPGATDFTVGYFNQTLNWRSTDGGETWTYIGIAGTGQGPHSATSTGFSDPDFAMDQAGNIYNVEIDLANVSVFKSPDDGQSYPTANPVAWSGDRPWVAANEPDEVYLYVNLPKQFLRSTDGGLTWIPSVGSIPIDSKPLTDPLNPDDGLIGPVGSVGRFAITGDDGATWETHNFGPRGSSRQFFGVLGVDKVGNVYQAAAGGYGGSNDTNPNGSVSFMYYDRAEERNNQNRIDIPAPEGDALWPWMVAGDEDRAAVVWYQSLAGEPTNFYPFIAVTHNATGTEVVCDDGTTKLIEPRFTVLNASGRPIHMGPICLSGTNCNANTSFASGDRRLGDFFSVAFDANGDLFIVSADTTLANALGGPKPVGNPIFIRQIGGDRMLAEPMELRPTRCLFPLPSC